MIHIWCVQGIPLKTALWQDLYRAADATRQNQNHEMGSLVNCLNLSTGGDEDADADEEKEAKKDGQNPDGGEGGGDGWVQDT